MHFVTIVLWVCKARGERVMMTIGQARGEYDAAVDHIGYHCRSFALERQIYVHIFALITVIVVPNDAFLGTDWLREPHVSERSHNIESNLFLDMAEASYVPVKRHLKTS